jgi:Fe-S cluster biosynthesis and repair protein YggX
MLCVIDAYLYLKLASHLVWQKQTVLVLEENQSLENALRRLLQELVVSFLTTDCWL